MSVSVQKIYPSWFRAYFTFKRVFYIGIILKGLDGAIEALTAIALVFVTPAQIHLLVSLVTRNELAEDPHDFISNLIITSTSGFNHSTIMFLVIYLSIHALVKLVSVIGILTKQRWAYPFALITLGLLTLYQFYEILVRPTLGIILLTILDLVIIWLIAREYRNIENGRDPGMVKA